MAKEPSTLNMPESELARLLDIELLENHIQNRVIKRQTHPTLPLAILNYTQKCQHENLWDSVTMRCRGLIYNYESGELVAVPFAKFFNYDTGDREETYPENLPMFEPEITTKLDGCFLYSTKVNLWGGGTLKIGDIVKNKWKVKLIGMDESGNIVPCDVIDWFDNGPKEDWIKIGVDCQVSKKAGCRTGNNIPITPNHSVWKNGDFQPAVTIKKDNFLMSYRDEVSPSVLHMMRSGLLGDGSLNTAHRAFKYSEGHKESHIDYVKAVREWLGECAITGDIRISGFGTIMHRAISVSLKSLENLRKEWYPFGGPKVVPKDLSWVDDFSIAKWYMDDGSLAHSDCQEDRALFATNGFTYNDVIRLSEKLTSMYGVSCTVYESKGWCLRINAGLNKEIETFWTKIAPHVVPCMRYKLPEKYRNVLYISYPKGILNKVPHLVRTLNTKVMGKDETVFKFGRRGFDIKTTTGNYFIRGILVHNSLGILWRYKDEWGIATRGSFTSDQAKWATKWFNDNANTNYFMTSFTPLFEIVYPENQVVVKYEYQGLTLLGCIDNGTGKELNYEDLKLASKCIGVPVVEKLNGESIEDLLDKDPENEEGYVATWHYEEGPPLKVKIKFATYFRLHRLLTGTSPKRIWEYLKDGLPLDELSKDVPEHFKEWINKWVNLFKDDFGAWVYHCKELFQSKPEFKTRKEFASWATSEENKPYSAILFKMLDNQPYEQLIWKELKTLTENLGTFRSVDE